jgi:hypothetical protein
MTLLQHARRARKTFWPGADRRTRCRMAAKYYRALVILGDKWLLARQVEKKAQDGCATERADEQLCLTVS